VKTCVGSHGAPGSKSQISAKKNRRLGEKIGNRFGLALRFHHRPFRYFAVEKVPQTTFWHALRWRSPAAIRSRTLVGNKGQVMALIEQLLQQLCCFYDERTSRKRKKAATMKKVDATTTAVEPWKR
jgi:hypothetical protein